jgi:hypothetical protein
MGRRSRVRRVLGLALAVLCAAVTGFPGGAAAQTQPEYLSWANPGPYLWPSYTEFQLDSFGAGQPVVTTYFFYWFEAAYLRQRAFSFDPFPYHPTDEATQSFTDPAWYLKQFTDMQAAGIDFVLPDYWGEPGQYARTVAPAPELNLFATQGLPPMVQALQQLEQAGHPLKIGLFLDTTILNNEDLTTLRGKQIFYASIRDYYSKIPPRLWAAIGGRPVIWLYDAQKVAAFDQSTFDYVYQQFPLDFGGLQPYIVREEQWAVERAPSHQVIRTEGMYGWGAAPFGYNPDPRFTVAQVGPGFQNTQLPGDNRIATPRNDGTAFRNELDQALTSGHQVLAIETWNELGEGSGILETQEFGRQYIDIAREDADRGHATTPLTAQAP